MPAPFCSNALTALHRRLTARSINSLLFGLCALLLGGEIKTATADSIAPAAKTNGPQVAPSVIAVQGNLPALPPATTDLKFGEFFTMPIGPRGLVPSSKLRALSGKTVRIVGYMVRASPPVAGMFILTPLPVTLGDEDESLSDDLPASAVFVQIDRAITAAPIPYFSGLLQLSGTLMVGTFEEADGHVSTVRLLLDADLTRAIMSDQSSSKKPS